MIKEPVYQISQILGMHKSEDGTEAIIMLKDEEKGEFGLRFIGDGLDFFHTFLGTIKYESSLRDPEGGQQPGEIVSVPCPDIVKNVNFGTSTVEGVTRPMLKFEIQNGLQRFLAFDKSTLESLKTHVQALQPPEEKTIN
ncbi:MAG: hypothetical protein IH923_04330 [Nitrospinae bacterium]|nr:hypothetical protein [Nitrospinota bacterium]